MSKRTTPASKTTPATTTPRRRAIKPAVDTTAAEAPKAPRTRRKTTTTDVTASTDVAASAPVRQPSHDDIAIRAYFIAIEQGADPVAAWLLAERELTTA
jgi:hypothetical protein